PVVALEPESWQRMMAVNAEASFLLARYALPYMKARGSGHFVAICSDAARRTFANGAAYIASKAAQDWFFQTLRRETRPFGIKVSVVFPGLTDTWFNSGTPGRAERSEDLKPTDIADAVAYILNVPQHVVIDEIMLHPSNQEW
ncbi:MAG: SDR family oxidoreductase, partial [Saprospiraceae bacterium]